jgi:3-phytase
MMIRLQQKLMLLTSVLLMFSANQALADKTPVQIMQKLGAGFNANYAAVFPAFAPGEKGQGRVELGEALIWRNSNGEVIAQYSHKLELLDWRYRGDEIWLATMVLPEQQPVILALNKQQHSLREIVRLPLPGFKAENLCLSQDVNNALFMYLLDERGIAEHWLVANGQGNVKPTLMRKLPIAPNSKSCSVDDTREQLFIAEEEVGIWMHPASVEAAPGRRPIAMNKPFGELRGVVESLVAIPGGLLALDSDKREILVYRQTDKGWDLVNTLSFPSLKKPDTLSAVLDTVQQQIQVLMGDEKTGQQYAFNLPWQFQDKGREHKLAVLSVQPEIQTQPVAKFGDAADDPAIWVNHKKPGKSLILGTNKQQGLFVYDMQGREVQRFDTGRLNNVDVRQGIMKGKARVDIAMATNRDDNSLSLYEINPRTGKMDFVASIATNMKEIYGFCLYQSPTTSDLYAIPNDKSGEFQQIRIKAVMDGAQKNTWQWQGELVRRFQVKTQPEGCVADDKRQRLFVGEEDTGIWTLGAEPDTGTELQLVMEAGEQLVTDVEGLAIYQHGQHPYLVVSSQGNNTYLVLDAVAPYQLRGAFRIDMDIARGIDGVSETDGLELLSLNFGGEFREGLLVVQDGHKVMPETPQNFKYVSWEKIRKGLGLE